MCSPSPPPPPDYTGAAEATSAGNKQLARESVYANRPNEYTPYGSRTWTSTPTLDQTAYDKALASWEGKGQVVDEPAYYEAERAWIDADMEGTAPNRADFMVDQGVAPDKSQFMRDQWSSQIDLSPEGQRLFDLSNQMKTGMGEMGLKGLAQMQDVFGSRFNVGSEMPTYGENRQKTMEAMLQRSDTDIERDRDRMRSTLVSQGIPVGSEAYNREMEQLDRKQTDARQQAEIAATQQAGQEYGAAMTGQRQRIQEALLNRQTPLNELNAFRSGGQVNMPQFGSYGDQGMTAGPDYGSAAAQQGQYALGNYNADVAQTNAQRNAAISAAMMYAMGASDIRLKHNINEIGIHKVGVPVYEFSYNGSDDRFIGVMAQDLLPVMPEAVRTMGNGYYAVNYGMLENV